jgi:hypothetical protein
MHAYKPLRPAGGLKFVQVECSWYRCCGRTAPQGATPGRAYCWGQVSDPNNVHPAFGFAAKQPTLHLSGPKLAELVAGQAHACAVFR